MCHVQGAGASASVPGETKDLYVVVLLGKKNTRMYPDIYAGAARDRQEEERQ